MAQLLSLVLTLKPRDAVSAPPHLGRAAHAALLRAVDAATPALAAQLHDDNGPKPFTCSSLMGKRAEGRLDPNMSYTLRYTALTDDLGSRIADLGKLAPSFWASPIQNPKSTIQNPKWRVRVRPRRDV